MNKDEARKKIEKMKKQAHSAFEWDVIGIMNSLLSIEQEDKKEWDVDAWFKGFQVTIMSVVEDKVEAKSIIDKVEEGMRKLEYAQYQKGVDAVDNVKASNGDFITHHDVLEALKGTKPKVGKVPTDRCKTCKGTALNFEQDPTKEGSMLCPDCML